MGGLSRWVRGQHAVALGGGLPSELRDSVLEEWYQRLIDGLLSTVVALLGVLSTIAVCLSLASSLMAVVTNR